MTAGTTVVAFHGEDGKPAPFAAFLVELQAQLTRLDAAFRPRPLAEVHATIIDVTGGDVAPFAASLRATLTREPLPVRFGGPFTGTAMTSRGRSLHERSFGVHGGTAVLIGWPVTGGLPHGRLADIRRGALRHGFRHRHGEDPDAHMVVGRLPPGSSAAEPVRGWLLERSCTVTVDVEHVAVVEYRDTDLPLSTSRSRPLTSFTTS